MAAPPVPQRFQPFELEEWQSRYETEVKYNLADLGVSPVRLDELVTTPEAVQVGSFNVSVGTRPSRSTLIHDCFISLRFSYSQLPRKAQALLATELHYPPVGGTPGLRSAIADWHGADAENVLVTVGAAEVEGSAVAGLHVLSCDRKRVAASLLVAPDVST